MKEAFIVEFPPAAAKTGKAATTMVVKLLAAGKRILLFWVTRAQIARDGVRERAWYVEQILASVVQLLMHAREL